MTKYREILRLKSLGFSERNIAHSCGVSRNTVAKVVKKAAEINLFELIHKRRKKSSTIFCSQFRESEWYQQICSGESTLADAIMDRISYDSYKINIESIDPSKDLSMREVYGLDSAQAE